MDTAISLSALNFVATTKIILVLAILACLVAWRRRRGAAVHLAVVTAALAIFYCLLAWPLQKMWWGNNGDEMFVGAAMTRAVSGGFFRDFYYSWLPPFYPPLYFWVIGLVGAVLHLTTLATLKFGVASTLVAAGWLPFLLAAWFWRGRPRRAEDEGLRSPWFWALAPVLFLLVVDFDAIILKPYEILPAILVALWIGWLAVSLGDERWSWRQYAWFGISGGLLFIAYYFWWFMIIPAMLVLALWSGSRGRGLVRFFVIGVIMAAVASPYLAPLAWAFWRYGVESWQAAYFMPADFHTFVPWGIGDVRAWLYLGGLVTIAVYRRHPFVRGLGVALAACYAYQAVNLVVFAVGGHPAQMAKPFLFLGSAILMTAAAYGIVQGMAWLGARQPRAKAAAGVALIALLLPLSPFVRFADDPVVQMQIGKDMTPPTAESLAKKLATAVPDYEQRVWLSSGVPDINLYLPLTYFIAYNPHFSHPSSLYSRRLEYLREMLSAGSPQEFSRLAASADPPINALLLYRDKASGKFPVFLWQDNYPNGGKEERLNLDPKLIDPAAWHQAWGNSEWAILTR